VWIVADLKTLRHVAASTYFGFNGSACEGDSKQFFLPMVGYHKMELILNGGETMSSCFVSYACC
jgi:hypothetical protein